MDLLLGLSSRKLLKLCKQNDFSIEAKYYPRLLLAIIKGAINSYQNRKEEKQFKEIIETKQVLDPVFIIGHWRSGTTFLHNVLINDEQFAYPNIFEISNPGNFLHREDKVLRHLKNMGNRKRPMDNIEINLGSPGEDEFAISALSLISPLFTWVFPNNDYIFNKYLTLKDAKDEEVRKWEEAFVLFLKKLTVRYDKKLLLKSPTHTGKISNILKLFPNAKFIHIYREQEKIFQSTKNLYKEIIPKTCFQTLNEDNLDKQIISNYKILYDKYLEDREKINQNNIVEVNYSDFIGNEISVVRKIYSKLNIDYSNQFEEKMKKYLDSQSNYKKNSYNPLTTEQKKYISSEISYIWDNLSAESISRKK